jgi:uncharacterized integral membrane protein
MKENRENEVLILIYLLTAIGLSPGGSSTVHIYTQTIHRTTQITEHKGKGKAIPLQAWTGPMGSRKLGLPDFKTIGT